MTRRFVSMVITGCVLMMCATTLFAPRAYFWNNDRGETKQEFPDVCRWTYHNSYVVWQDARAGDYDIWGQAIDKDGALIGENICINDKKRGGDQIFPSIACMKENPYAVVVWQHWNDDNGSWEIMGQLISDKGEYIGEMFQVNDEDGDKFNQEYPAVAFSNGEFFTVCWHDDRNAGAGWGSDIYARTFRTNGGGTPEPLTPYDDLINREQKNDQFFPDVSYVSPTKSRASYLMCYAWQHYGYGQDNPTEDIVIRRWTIEDDKPQPYDPKDSLVIDKEAYSKCNSLRPAIGSDGDANMIIAWEDDRARATTVYFQIMKGDLSFVNNNRPITPGAVTWSQIRCDAMSRSDGDATVVWHDNRNGNWDVFAQCLNIKEGGYNGGNWPVNEPTADGSQIYPAIDRDDAGEAMHSVTWMDNRRPVGMYDIYFRVLAYNGEPVTDEIEVSRLFGVEAEYDDDEDYDIPATPLWNEDPRTDPVVRTEAAKAVIDMIKENDIDGYWQIFEADTFPGRKQKGRTSWVDSFNIVLIDLGWRHGLTLSGQMTTEEQSELVDYLYHPTGLDTGRVVIIGNDFGRDYEGTQLYEEYFRLDSIESDGNVWTTGNVEKLEGQSGWFTHGMNMSYRYQDTCDNYVDNISSAGAAMIFEAENPQKVFFFGGSAYSFAWKGNPDKTVHLSFSLSGISSDNHPNTSIELVRRMMAWLDQRVAPAPVTDLLAGPGAAEGEVVVTWRAPWNQNVPPKPVTDPASGYTLKFTYWEDNPPHYGKITSDAEFNAANTYYQTWTPEMPETSEEQTLRGLPPGTPLIFAIKGYDSYLGETRNATLGDEPLATVAGDLVTPHSIYVGNDSYGGGYVRDFLRNEIMDTRIGNSPGSGRDTLWFTWDASNLYIGYARHSWESYGDFLVYFDVTTGGADSTYPMNGSSNRCRLPDDCQADYCFAVESHSNYRLYHYSGSSWVSVSYGGDFSLDNVVNGYRYTEFSIPFSSLSYNPIGPFKFLACCQNETNNNNWNAFPAENLIGTKGQDLNYYYYFDCLGSGISPGDTVVSLNIELSAFTATCRMDGIELLWRTESEEDIYQWAVEKKQGDEFVEIGRVGASGNSQVPAEYRFLDKDVEYGNSYIYKLFYITGSGRKTECGSMTVPFIPSVFRDPYLYPISPNPVRSNANATFLVTKRGVASLRVYDLTGRAIQTVVNEEKEPGLYTINVSFKDCAQGVYFIEFMCGGERALRKVTLLR